MKQKKKVVFLGGSLPVLIFAYLYKKKFKNHEVFVFDKSSNLGGAWQNFKYKNISIRKQSNIILSESKEIEKKQDLINSFLKNNVNAKIKKIQEHVKTKYNAKRQFFYNFESFKNIIKQSNLLKRIKVNKIEIKEKSIIINNKISTDKVFFPVFFGLKKILINNKIKNINYKIINSEHVIAITKPTSFNNIFYSDFHNNFFDRVEFLNHNKFCSFSARITKGNKGASKKEIRNELIKIFGEKKIKDIYKFKYRNYYRNKDDFNNLNKISIKNRFEIIDTRSFIIAIQQIMFFLKKI